MKKLIKNLEIITYMYGTMKYNVIPNKKRNEIVSYSIELFMTSEINSDAFKNILFDFENCLITMQEFTDSLINMIMSKIANMKLERDGYYIAINGKKKCRYEIRKLDPKPEVGARTSKNEGYIEGENLKEVKTYMVNMYGTTWQENYKLVI